MFNWFKQFFKKEVPIVVEEEEIPVFKPPVVAKVADGAPQVKDYPRSKYNAYWEVFHTTVNTRHHAKVRFCSFVGKVLSESELTAATKETLFEKVNALVKSKMESYKR